MSIQSCEFVVSGQPIGKGRPRFTKTGRVYTPQKTKEYETRVRNSAWAEMAKQRLKPSERRMSVILQSCFEIPKSYSKKQVLECQAGVQIPKRVDLDNLIKSILDGCNGIVWHDDQQVWHISAFKRYVDVNQEPHTRIKIQWDQG